VRQGTGKGGGVVEKADVRAREGLGRDRGGGNYPFSPFGLIRRNKEGTRGWLVCAGGKVIFVWGKGTLKGGWG